MGPCRSKERQADTLIILDKSLARTAKHQQLNRAVRQFACNAATASAMQLARAEDDEPLAAALAVSALAAAVSTSTDLQALTSRPLTVGETERQTTDEAAEAAAVSAEPAKKRTQAVTTTMQPPTHEKFQCTIPRPKASLSQSKRTLRAPQLHQSCPSEQVGLPDGVPSKGAHHEASAASRRLEAVFHQCATGLDRSALAALSAGA